MLFAVAAVAVVLVAGGLIVTYRSAQVEDAVIHEAQVIVVTGSDIQCGEPVPYPIQVYLNCHRLLSFLILGVLVLGVASLLIVRLLLVGFLVAVLLIALFLIRILVLVFVLLLSDFITAWA